MTDNVVAAARTWIGTPYLHQASCKGVGTDCLGLIRGIWRELLGTEPETPPAYTMDWGDDAENPVLFQAAARHLIKQPNSDENLGDVLLFRMRDGFAAKHLGIQSSVGANRTFIHAYSGHAVCENHLSDPWRRRIAARFRFPI